MAFGWDSAPLEQAIREEQQRIKEAEAKAAEAKARARNHAAAFARDAAAHLTQIRTENSERARILADTYPPFLRGDWPEQAWSEWIPASPPPPGVMTVGELSDPEDEDFRIPAFIPFIGQGATVVIPSTAATAETALETLQALVLRGAVMLPHQARFTFIDPARQGRGFPMARGLPTGHVRVVTADVMRHLSDVLRDIDRLNAAYIDKQTPSFDVLPPEVRLNERFELIFVAEYPDGFDRRAIEALRQISRNGPPAGKYLFVHWNRDLPGPRDVRLDDFHKIHYVTLDEDVQPGGYRFTPSSAPSPAVERHALSRLAAVKPPERKLGWRDIVEPRDGRIWTGSAARRIETPVGGGGANQTLNVWFGVNDEGRPCAHGMLGGMPGSGKSNLYHVLILGLAVRYAPDELRMYLVDGKFGVEFQDYRGLPHADVVSLHTPAELSRSVLAELLDELERRNALFAKHGVVDLSGYRQANQPSGPVPRVLLLVDEYQELFEDDREGVASAQLLRLAQQGRSAGIHMLLGAQKFGVAGLMHQSAVMGSIHLRIAMQLPHDLVMALSEFGREGRRLIAACDLPGKIVINDQNGDDERNAAGKVAFLDADVRRDWIARLRQKAIDELPAGTYGRGIVCDGEAQPIFTENPFVRASLGRDRRPTASEQEASARRPSHEGGLNADDWYAGERPFVLWLGQEFNVRGHARLILRRRATEAVTVVGGSQAARYGMFAAMALSLGIFADPAAVRICVIDRSMPDTPWRDTLANVTAVLSERGFTVTFDRGGPEAERRIEDVVAEVERRRSLTEEELLAQPSTFLLIADADRLRSLERVAGRIGMEDSPLGKRLQIAVADGPAVGIHPVLGFTGFLPLTRTLDPRRLDLIRHRIALQISEDDSFTLVRTRRAAQLQSHGPTPVAALYWDSAGGKDTRFKPYAVDDKADWPAQMKLVSNRLAEWGARHGDG
jgi:DNA segregation ATPase FtsK/SpoIIIE, S-DNA-T family